MIDWVDAVERQARKNPDGFIGEIFLKFLQIFPIDNEQY
jgi:hypothetical protein